MQVVEAKLPMLGPAEKTRIKKMIYERQSDRGTTDVRMDNAASTSPVGVFHQICNDDLTMSGICHTSMEAWKTLHTLLVRYTIAGPGVSCIRYFRTTSPTRGRSTKTHNTHPTRGTSSISTASSGYAVACTLTDT